MPIRTTLAALPHGAALALVAALAVAPTIALASTIQVPADFGTIQAAIDAAAPGDEVVIAPGTYTGAGNRDVEFLGKAITVRSANPADSKVVAMTIVDCQQLGRGFLFHDGETQGAVLDGLTITNGLADRGGGIRVMNSTSPTIRRCVITGNTATTFGGGVSSDHVVNDFGDLVLVDCTVSGNGPDGVRTFASDAHITRCAITGNAGPGVVATYGDVYIIEGATIVDNQGTGIELEQPQNVTIAASTIARNTSLAGTGGIRLFANDTVDVRNCMIVDNIGEYGGGITSGPSFGLVSVTGCTVSGNTATDMGGGIVAAASDVILLNSIVSANDAPNGPELLLSSGFNHPATLQADYSLLALGDDGMGILVLSRAGSTSQFIFGTGNIVDVSPSFIDASGGDYHLSVNSAAIDAGDPAFVAAPGESDIDGDSRVIGVRVDLGADERGPCTATCQADFTGVGGPDGSVDSLDFLLLIAQWGSPCIGGCEADITGPTAGPDGNVDALDFLLLISQWDCVAECP